MTNLILFISLSFLELCTSLHSNLDDLWNSYKENFGKQYNSSEEDTERRIIWEHNFKLILKHNKEEESNKHGFKLGINHLSDKYPLEYSRFNDLIVNSKELVSNIYSPPSGDKYPKSVDWTQKGLVTEVKNQGDCGSCWAFSAVGSLEGQHKKKTGRLQSLSAQNLLDCSKNEGNRGCIGGLMDPAFAYIKYNGGIETDELYPYVAKEQDCQFEKSKIRATLRSWVDVQPFDEDALMKAVANIGPISAGMNANGYGFSSYQSGIYDVQDCDPLRLTHAILIVGYGKKDNKDYWKIKNSWGTMWGEKGYAKIRRNKNNLCGIASLASYPIV